jgi:micrococcal nuclease
MGRELPEVWRKYQRRKRIAPFKQPIVFVAGFAITIFAGLAVASFTNLPHRPQPQAGNDRGQPTAQAGQALDIPEQSRNASGDRSESSPAAGALEDGSGERTLSGRIKVIDGDTVRVGRERIRIAGIDSPEMPPKSRCSREAILAGQAKSRLEAMVSEGYEIVFIPKLGEERDAYGRLLGRIEIDGQDVGRAQLAAGLAQPWHGRHAQWC